eukprot:g3431.t1
MSHGHHRHVRGGSGSGHGVREDRNKVNSATSMTLLRQVRSAEKKQLINSIQKLKVKQIIVRGDLITAAKLLENYMYKPNEHTFEQKQQISKSQGGEVPQKVEKRHSKGGRLPHVPVGEDIEEGKYSQKDIDLFWSRWEFVNYGESVGRGHAHIQMYRGRNKESGIPCVIKCFKKHVFTADETSDAAEKQAVQAENVASRKEIVAAMEVARRVKHPGIVEFYDWCEDATHRYIVYEFVRGPDLFHALVKRFSSNRIWNEAHARDIMKQLTSIVMYLHSKELYHRDIKPENIIISTDPVTGNEVVNVIGLGAVAINGASTTTSCGVALYSAPEAMKFEERHRSVGMMKHSRFEAYSPEHADMFSLGAVLFVLLSGVEPFGSVEAWMDCRLTFDLAIWKHISSSAKDLIVSLCNKNPLLRPNCLQVLAHPWVTSTSEDNHIDLGETVGMGVAKLSAEATYKAKLSQWKVINMVQSNASNSHHINIMLVDNADFHKEYFCEGKDKVGSPITGTTPAAQLARSLGMRQYKAKTVSMLKFIEIRDVELEALSRKFPNAKCVPSPTSLEDGVIEMVVVGSAAKQKDMAQFLEGMVAVAMSGHKVGQPGSLGSARPPFGLLYAYKKDAFAVQVGSHETDDPSKRGTGRVIKSYHEKSTSAQESFVFESLQVKENGEADLCFVALGDYLAYETHSDGQAPSIWRLEKHTFEGNYTPVPPGKIDTMLKVHYRKKAAEKRKKNWEEKCERAKLRAEQHAIADNVESEEQIGVSMGTYGLGDGCHHVASALECLIS